MVSTPDVAKDLFSGLWEQNTDLYQAYQNLGAQNTTYPSSSSSSSCSQPIGAPYNVVTTSYIPMTCSPPSTSVYLPPSTSYIPKSTPPTKSSYIACPTPPYVAPQAAASRQQGSPSSRYSSPASCGSSTGSSDVGKVETLIPDAPSTSDYTKLALILISQSQKKKYSREEEEKRRVRRERNKVAATKCRIKRRAHSTNVGTEYSEVVATQKKLEDEIECLQREKAELQSLLKTHYCHKTHPAATTSYQPSQPPPPYQPPSTQPPPYTPPTTTPDMSFVPEFFIKAEPGTPSIDVEIDPFN